MEALNELENVLASNPTRIKSYLYDLTTDIYELNNLQSNLKNNRNVSYGTKLVSIELSVKLNDRIQCWWYKIMRWKILKELFGLFEYLINDETSTNVNDTTTVLYIKPIFPVQFIIEVLLDYIDLFVLANIERNIVKKIVTTDDELDCLQETFDYHYIVKKLKQLMDAAKGNKIKYGFDIAYAYLMFRVGKFDECINTLETIKKNNKDAIMYNDMDLDVYFIYIYLLCSMINGNLDNIISIKTEFYSSKNSIYYELTRLRSFAVIEKYRKLFIKKIIQINHILNITTVNNIKIDQITKILPVFTIVESNENEVVESNEQLNNTIANIAEQYGNNIIESLKNLNHINNIKTYIKLYSDITLDKLEEMSGICRSDLLKILALTSNIIVDNDFVYLKEKTNKNMYQERFAYLTQEAQSMLSAVKNFSLKH